ncbi:MAG: polysaccharide deacetylase family protein, partial [Verrucomicrobia bacterium]|nr:polysaccharide deacetylase family protein [Verrucomicrobiota bacterium]
SLAKRTGQLLSRSSTFPMMLTKSPIFAHDSAGPTPWSASVLRFLRSFGSLPPAPPHFPALRSGHRLFQRPSPGKQFSSNRIAIAGLILTAALLPMSYGLAGEEVKRVETDQPLVALTFDDGPSKVEEQLLALFEKEGVKVTFFFNGNNVVKKPEWALRVSEAGHEIGNHSFTHPNFGTIKDIEKTRSEVLDTQKAIKEATGKDAVLFRAPFLAHSDMLWSVLDELKMQSISASVISGDWQNGVKKETVLENATANTKAGDVILMHSWGYHTVALMPEIIARLKAKGLKCVTVSQLLAARSRGPGKSGN